MKIDWQFHDIQRWRLLNNKITVRSSNDGGLRQNSSSRRDPNPGGFFLPGQDATEWYYRHLFAPVLFYLKAHRPPPPPTRKDPHGFVCCQILLVVAWCMSRRLKTCTLELAFAFWLLLKGHSWRTTLNKTCFGCAMHLGVHPTGM